MDENKRDTMHGTEEMTEQSAVPQTESKEGRETKEPCGDIKEIKAQLDEYKDRCLRAYAEMDNMRKRLARERQDIVKYGTEKLLKDFLLVYDAIEKSIHTAEEMHPEDEQFIQGLRMTEKLFLETLKKHQVEPIEAENMPFDPRYHEAMMQVTEGNMPKGMVVKELEKGFTVHDRLLRPAKVAVSG
ncbi:MAG TPA: nucleotide exchange factor GrpE [Deltaproteobacteria bacterium]|jgi:molecular chaperone GrpE|nr:nucleotide exchange factor GrpE [Deltaproteobacteria bacterium]HQH99975.1 nucleotide exchange factor GrpE [Deltaproteobacteria bacterium]HQJ08255.1 nucleotide exchange factor GrpE [Deltaproteobacteria bacterium]